MWIEINESNVMQDLNLHSHTFNKAYDLCIKSNDQQ